MEEPANQSDGHTMMELSNFDTGIQTVPEELPNPSNTVSVKVEKNMDMECGRSKETDEEDEDEHEETVVQREEAPEVAGSETSPVNIKVQSTVELNILIPELEEEVELSDGSEVEDIDDGELEIERVEDKLKCLICRAQLNDDNYINAGAEELRKWQEQCAETLCELLFHSELHPFKYYFENGGYCKVCQSKIWDVDFTWRKLVSLREKVDEISRSLRQDLIDNYWRVEHKSSKGLPDIDLIKIIPTDLYGNYSYDEVIQMIYKVQENVDFLDLTCEPDLPTDMFSETVAPRKFKHRSLKKGKHRSMKNKPKGKRGRPRKHFNVPPVITPVVKRPRGRPKKYNTEEIGYIESSVVESIDIPPEVVVVSDDPDNEHNLDGRKSLRRKASQKVSEVLEAMLSDQQSDAEEVGGFDNDVDYFVVSDTDIEYEEVVKQAKKARKREKKAKRREARRLALGLSSHEHEEIVVSDSTIPSNRVPCKVPGCDRHFIKESTMLLHVRRVHDGEKNPFLCVYCDQTFETRNEFRRHQYVHPEYNTKDYHFVRKSYEHTCKVCSKGFEKEEELNNHNAVHQGPNPFICCDCGSEFSNSVDLRTHIAEKHPEPDTPKCEVCGKIFSAMASKRIHMRIHLNPQELPKCPVCAYTGYSQSALKNHMMTHSTERAFQCDTCGKTYKNVEGLRYHKRNHTGERPHKCTLCGKGFRQSGHLKRHEEVHSGLKKHICSHCGKAWASIDNLKAHEKIHTRDPNNPIRGRIRKPKNPAVNTFKKIQYHHPLPVEVDTKDDSHSTHSIGHPEEYHPSGRFTQLPSSSSSISQMNHPSPPHLGSHSGVLFSSSGLGTQIIQVSHPQPIHVPNLSHINFRSSAPGNFPQSQHSFYNNFNNF